jgi:cytochrome b subunit of formate dehydrogenase
MPLNEAELSRPKRVLVAVILLYAALSIGVACIVLDLYLAYPVTGPPWLTTMVNKTGIAWLLPIVVILSAFGNCCFIFSHNLPDRPGKELGQNLLFLVLWLIGIFLFLAGISLRRYLAARPISGMFALLQYVLQVVALILLFQNESSRWSRKSVGPAQPVDTP